MVKAPIQTEPLSLMKASCVLFRKYQFYFFCLSESDSPKFL